MSAVQGQDWRVKVRIDLWWSNLTFSLPGCNSQDCVRLLSVDCTCILSGAERITASFRHVLSISSMYLSEVEFGVGSWLSVLLECHISVMWGCVDVIMVRCISSEFL
jgi:hypothetical protein